MKPPRLRYLIVNDRRRGSCKLPAGLYQGRTGPDPTHEHFTVEIPDVDTWRTLAQKVAQKYPDRHFWADVQVLESTPPLPKTGESTAEPPRMMPAAAPAAGEPTLSQTAAAAGNKPEPCQSAPAFPAAQATLSDSPPPPSVKTAPAAEAPDKPAPRPPKDPQAELLAAIVAAVTPGAKRLSELAESLAVEAADIQAAVTASSTLAMSARAGWVSLKK